VRTRRRPGRPGGRFVVHEHQATRLHYDLRLEAGGVLKSWALPKGPSMNPADKRLAIAVPDHPLEYADYEGVIPEGTYGAGPVVVWDSGRWDPTEAGDPEEQLDRGKLTFRLQGRELRGEWVLTRLARGSGKDWLLIKRKDAAADPAWRLSTALTPRRLAKLVVKVPPCEAH
jgi:DNA ligase D-like protein (predicted 3'-phosphoesterase)